MAVCGEGRPGDETETLIRRLYEVIDGSRWDALQGLFVPDCTYERPGYQPLCGVDRLLDFSGRERIVASGEHRLEQVVGDAVHAATWGRFVGTSRDGRALDELFADVFQLRDGRIARRRTHFFRPAV